MRQIIGVQLHHHVFFDDASRGFANGLAGLSGVVSATGDPEVAALVEDGKALLARVSAKRAESVERFNALWKEDPERFRRCRDGLERWPDETVGAFVPRCTCHDRCLHELGYEPGELGVCNCDKPPCGQHPEGE